MSQIYPAKNNRTLEMVGISLNDQIEKFLEEKAIVIATA